MQSDIPVSRRKRRRWPILLIVAAGLFFVFFCSGIRFPMWGPQGALNRHLSDDLGITLPAGAKVTCGAWVAYRDPGEYFAVEMPTDEVAGFVQQVRSKSGTEAEDVESKQGWTMGPRPDWWRPQDLANVKRFDIRHRDGMGGYIWYYSEPAGRLYVFWFRT